MTDDKVTWSPQAHRAHKSAASADTSALQMRRWERGPHLDRHKIIVPSDFYHPEIAAFFKAQGFHFDGDARQWWRDTRWPHHGRRYPPAAWLQAARRKFAEIWKKEKET